MGEKTGFWCFFFCFLVLLRGKKHEVFKTESDLK